MPLIAFLDLDLAIKLIRSHKKSRIDTDIAELFWKLEILSNHYIKAILGEIQLKLRELQKPLVTDGDLEMI
jgi:hypothetical protein